MSQVSKSLAKELKGRLKQLFVGIMENFETKEKRAFFVYHYDEKHAERKLIKDFSEFKLLKVRKPVTHGEPGKELKELLFENPRIPIKDILKNHKGWMLTEKEIEKISKEVSENPRQIIPVTKKKGSFGYFGVYDAKTDELLSTFFHKPVTDKAGIREHAQKIADMFKTRARVRRL